MAAGSLALALALALAACCCCCCCCLCWWAKTFRTNLIVSLRTTCLGRLLGSSPYGCCAFSALSMSIGTSSLSSSIKVLILSRRCFSATEWLTLDPPLLLPALPYTPPEPELFLGRKRWGIPCGMEPAPFFEPGPPALWLPADLLLADGPPAFGWEGLVAWAGGRGCCCKWWPFAAAAPGTPAPAPIGSTPPPAPAGCWPLAPGPACATSCVMPGPGAPMGLAYRYGMCVCCGGWWPAMAFGAMCGACGAP
mmetsp:Transcript_29304/g.62085  ORF Transcript_29304/g.62085 Transcript_29304/m.62085 type:complete len:251 (+) Transcript_29304:1088-1840(+)